MTVAILFARSDSYYKTLPECDVWDIERDARKWPGGAPVVAHPPCRAWGVGDGINPLLFDREVAVLPRAALCEQCGVGK